MIIIWHNSWACVTTEMYCCCFASIHSESLEKATAAACCWYRWQSLSVIWNTFNSIDQNQDDTHADKESRFIEISCKQVYDTSHSNHTGRQHKWWWQAATCKVPVIPPLSLNINYIKINDNQVTATIKHDSIIINGRYNEITNSCGGTTVST